MQSDSSEEESDEEDEEAGVAPEEEEEEEEQPQRQGRTRNTSTSAAAAVPAAGQAAGPSLKQAIRPAGRRQTKSTGLAIKAVGLKRKATNSNGGKKSKNAA